MTENRVMFSKVSFDGDNYTFRVPKTIAEKADVGKGDKIKFSIVDEKLKLDYIRRMDGSDESKLDKTEYRILEFLRAHPGEVFTINEIRLWLNLGWDVAKKCIAVLKDYGYVTAYEENRMLKWMLVSEEMSDLQDKDHD